MAWFKIDDGFWSHPKVLTLPATAGWLWVRAGTYSMQHLTDGVVLEPILRMLGTVEDAEDLVAAGLWIRDGAGYAFHDWDKYQPSKDDVEADRERNAERQRKWRDRRRESQGDSGVSNGERNALRDALVTPSVTAPRPDPTRPDPTPIEEPKGSSSLSKRGTRIDPAWMPDQELIQQMRDECPSVDLEAEHRKFIDHWIAQPGQKGVKLDWSATWRNWIRRSAPKQAAGRAPAQKQTAVDKARAIAADMTSFGGLEIDA